MAEGGRGEQFRIVPGWLRADLMSGALNWSEFCLMNFLWQVCNPFSGIHRTFAAELAGRMHPWAVDTVRYVMRSLKDKLYIWYPGEEAGEHVYPIHIHRFQIGRNKVLHTYNRKGELCGEAAAYVKKRQAPGSGSLLPSKRTPGRTAGLTPGVLPGDVPGVPDEKPAPNEGPSQGVSQGLPKPESLSIAGLSPTDGGNYRRVSPRDVPGASADASTFSDPQILNDPSVVSREGDHTQTPPPSGSSPGEDRRRQQILELASHFRRALEAAVPGCDPKVGRTAELAIAGELLDAHGIELVKAAIDSALQDDYWSKGCHTFKTLHTKWSYIKKLLDGGGKGATRKHRGNHRAHQGLPGPDHQYSSTDPAKEPI